MSPSTVRRIGHVVLVLAFVGAIGFPAVRWLCAGHVRPTTAAFDMLSHWATDFESSFPSRVGNANKYRRLRQRLFGIMPQTVITGAEGWLFYDSAMAADGDTFDDLRGRSRLTPAQAAEWADVLVARERDLTARGACYVTVIVPNKEGIYPEFLPVLEQRRRSSMRRLDDLLAACVERGCRPIDLRLDLCRAKLERRAFHRTDSHWTDHGTATAYRAILGDLAQRLPDLAADLTPLPETAFAWSAGAHLGDLAALAMIADAEVVERLVPRIETTAHMDDSSLLLRQGEPLASPAWAGSEPRVLVTEGGRGRAVAVVFHDSFMLQLAPLLAQHFRRVCFVHGLFDPAVVARERPDLVLHEVVERHLQRLSRTAE